MATGEKTQALDKVIVMLTNILASTQVIASCESNKLYSYIALEQLRVVLTRGTR